MAEGTTAGDELGLEVPTTPDLLRLVRVAASGIASRLGFAFDAVEDVRLAVDELCWSVAGGAGPAATIVVRFRLLDRAFSVEGRLRAEGGELRPLSAVSEKILGTLVESYELLPAADGMGPGFTMTTKQA